MSAPSTFFTAFFVKYPKKKQSRLQPPSAFWKNAEGSFFFFAFFIPRVLQRILIYHLIEPIYLHHLKSMLSTKHIMRNFIQYPVDWCIDGQRKESEFNGLSLLKNISFIKNILHITQHILTNEHLSYETSIPLETSLKNSIKWFQSWMVSSRYNMW